MKPFFWICLFSLFTLIAAEDPLMTRVVQRANWVEETVSFLKKVSVGASPKSFIREVFSKNSEGIINYNRYVLGQLKEKALLELVGEVLKDETLSDREIYEALYGQIHKAKYGKFVQAHYSLQATKAMQRDLAWQVAELMEKKPVVGYLEMGQGGDLIKPLKRALALSGPIYVFNDIAGKDIPAESLELVACYSGLHAIPPEKLQPFLASIYRSLRPGGTFILREHDAATEELRSLSSVAYTLSNLATHVTPIENEREIHHFRGLTYWIHLLKEQGFEYNTREPLIRKGDSTKNALLRFDKPRHTKLLDAPPLKGALLKPKHPSSAIPLHTLILQGIFIKST